MDKRQQPKRNTVLLVTLILVAVAYCLWLYYRLPLTGNWKLDGIIGVLSGLYVASHPRPTCWIYFSMRAAI